AVDSGGRFAGVAGAAAHAGGGARARARRTASLPLVAPATLLAIVMMAAVTSLTRIGGYILLRNRSLGPRAMAVLEAAPGCVLISVIAPAFVSDRPTDL